MHARLTRDVAGNVTPRPEGCPAGEGKPTEGVRVPIPRGAGGGPPAKRNETESFRIGSGGREGGCVLSAARSLRIGAEANELSDSPSTNPSLKPVGFRVVRGIRWAGGLPKNLPACLRLK